MDTEVQLDIPTPRWRRLSELKPLQDTNDYGVIDDDDSTYVARHSVLAKRERASWDVARGSNSKKKKPTLKYPTPSKCQELVENALSRARELAAGAPTAANDTVDRDALRPSLATLRVIARLDKAVGRAKKELGDLPNGPLHAALHAWTESKLESFVKEVAEMNATTYLCFGNMLPQVGWAPTPPQSGIKKLLHTTQNAVDTADDCIEVPAVEEQTELFADLMRDELRNAGFELVAEGFRLRPGYHMDGNNGASVYPVQVLVPDEYALVENGLRIDARWIGATPNLKKLEKRSVYSQPIPRKSAGSRNRIHARRDNEPGNPALRSSKPRNGHEAMLLVLNNHGRVQSRFQTQHIVPKAATAAVPSVANGVRRNRRHNTSSSDIVVSLHEKRRPVESQIRRTCGSPSSHSSEMSLTVAQSTRFKNLVARKTASVKKRRRR